MVSFFILGIFMDDSIKETYERFKHLCSGPTMQPCIVLNPCSAFRQSGKSTLVLNSIQDIIESGFIPLPIGTSEDHSQLTLILTRSKKRPVPPEGQLPYTFHFNSITEVIKDLES